jgi:hypothetical protein
MIQTEEIDNAAFLKIYLNVIQIKLLYHFKVFKPKVDLRENITLCVRTRLRAQELQEGLCIGSS